MHEAALAAPLLQLVLAELESHGSGRLVATRITLRAGLLTGIEPPTLQGCFSLMAEGTDAAGATLLVEPEPMHGLCPGCRREVSTEKRRFHCPLCAGTEVRWTGGNEMYIASIAVREKGLGGN